MLNSNEYVLIMLIHETKIVGILTLISINTLFLNLKAGKSFTCQHFRSYEQLKFHAPEES